MLTSLGEYFRATVLNSRVLSIEVGFTHRGDRGTVEHFRVGHPLNNAGVPHSGFLNFFAFSHPLAL